MMVNEPQKNRKNTQTQTTETMRNLRRNQPKFVKNHNTEKHRQRWSNPNNRIRSDGKLCPKHNGIALLRKKGHRIATKI